MWNIVSGNRLLDRKRKEQAHKKHIRALNNIRSQIDNTAPQEYHFMYSRPKATQMKIQRQMDIQNSNTILIQKMMKSSSNVRQGNDVSLKQSLNSIYRSRMERQIDDGNQKLVRRLQTIKSQYSCFGKSMKDYNKYKSNMAHSRMDPYYDLEGQTAPIAFKSNRPNSAKK